jgi:hypothetical protein
MSTQLPLPASWAVFESKRDPHDRLIALRRDMAVARNKIREALQELADRQRDLCHGRLRRQPAGRCRVQRRARGRARDRAANRAVALNAGSRDGGRLRKAEGIIDMTNETPTVSSPALSFIDNPLAPDVLADEAVGFWIHGGIVRITLTTGRWNHAAPPPGAVNRVVIGRLSMPVEGARALAIQLYDFLKARGVVQDSLPLGQGPPKPN